MSACSSLPILKGGLRLLQLLRPAPCFSFWEEKQETICHDVSPKLWQGGEARGSVLRFASPRRMGCSSTASFL